MTTLTPEERNELEQTIRWHMNVHQQEDGDLYKSLCIENAILKTERILTKRLDAQREAIADAIETTQEQPKMPGQAIRLAARIARQHAHDPKAAES